PLEDLLHLGGRHVRDRDRGDDATDGVGVRPEDHRTHLVRCVHSALPDATAGRAVEQPQIRIDRKVRLRGPGRRRKTVARDPHLDLVVGVAVVRCRGRAEVAARAVEYAGSHSLADIDRPGRTVDTCPGTLDRNVAGNTAAHAQYRTDRLGSVDVEIQ